MGIDTNLIYRGDCHSVLKREFPDKCVDLIYMDPPFSFDSKYARLWYDKGALEIFEEIRKGDVKHYVSWMEKRLIECHRVLKDTGSFYLHCDWKFGHHLKVKLDEIFGEGRFRNEIIWHYFMGGKPKHFFARKHDTIFFYTKSKNKDWTFNIMKHKRRLDFKPSLPAKSSSGKATKPEIGKDEFGYYSIVTMDDVWDIKGVFNMSREWMGYPTQKPLELLERIIKASSNEGDIVLDPMCGCGTTIAAAHKLRRKWIGIDISSQACETIRNRMESLEGIVDIEVRGLPLTVKDLQKLDPFEFQDYICDMTDSERGKRGSDMGIDGHHLGETPLQIKQTKVGRTVVEQFEAALERKKKNKGYIIGFSFSTGKNGAWE